MATILKYPSDEDVGDAISQIEEWFKNNKSDVCNVMLFGGETPVNRAAIDVDVKRRANEVSFELNTKP